MLTLNLLMIGIHVLIAWPMSRLWLQLRNPSSAQSEYLNQRAPGFRRFMVLFIPLMLLNFLFQIINACFNVYAVLRSA